MSNPATDISSMTDLTASGEAFDLLTNAAALGEAQADPAELDACLARAAEAAAAAWPGGSQPAYAFAVLAADIRRRAMLWRLVRDVTGADGATVVLLVDEVEEVTRHVPGLAAALEP